MIKISLNRKPTKTKKIRLENDSLVVLALLVAVGLGLTSISLWVKRSLFEKTFPLVTLKTELSPRAETLFYFQPETKTVELHTSLPLLIKVASGQNTLAGVEMALQYDPQFLQVISVVPGDFFQPATILNQQIDNTQGLLSFTLLCPPEKPQKGEGNLVLINFEAKKITAGKFTQVTFLPQTQAAAIKEEKNVLKSFKAALVKII
jgi:hypothetical protein